MARTARRTGTSFAPAGRRSGPGGAINLADKLHGPAIYDRIRARFPSLSPHDVTEVWDDTLLKLLCRRAQGRLEAIGIARRVAVPHLLAPGRRSAAAAVVAERHGATGGGATWNPSLRRCRLIPRTSKELLRPVRDEIRRLASRQREVWEIYAELGFEVSLKELTEAVNTTTGNIGFRNDDPETVGGRAQRAAGTTATGVPGMVWRVVRPPVRGKISRLAGPTVQSAGSGWTGCRR